VGKSVSGTVRRIRKRWATESVAGFFVFFVVFFGGFFGRVF
jgi:hypothetical protein